MIIARCEVRPNAQRGVHLLLLVGVGRSEHSSEPVGLLSEPLGYGHHLDIGHRRGRVGIGQVPGRGFAFLHRLRDPPADHGGVLVVQGRPEPSEAGVAVLDSGSCDSLALHGHRVGGARRADELGDGVVDLIGVEQVLEPAVDGPDDATLADRRGPGMRPVQSASSAAARRPVRVGGPRRSSGHLRSGHVVNIQPGPAAGGYRGTGAEVGWNQEARPLAPQVTGRAPCGDSGRALIEMVRVRWKTPNGKDTLGLLVLTPRRIIFRGWLVFDQGAKMAPIEQVVSVSSSKGMALGSIQVGVMGEDWNLTHVNKDDAARFATAVQHLLHHRQQQAQPSQPPQRQRRCR